MINQKEQACLDFKKALELGYTEAENDMKKYCQ